MKAKNALLTAGDCDTDWFQLDPSEILLGNKGKREEIENETANHAEAQNEKLNKSTKRQRVKIDGRLLLEKFGLLDPVPRDEEAPMDEGEGKVVKEESALGSMHHSNVQEDIACVPQAQDEPMDEGEGKVPKKNQL